MVSKTSWIIYDQGKIGTLNQCLGLAEALGLSSEIKAVQARFPWSYLPPRFWVCPLKALVGEPLTPPWPDVIIAGGRLSVAPAAAIRRLSQGKTKIIQLLNPHLSFHNFDAVVAPAHDQLVGPNVISTIGALHRVTHQRLQEDAERFSSHFKTLPRPLVAVLVGGSNGVYTINKDIIDQLAKDLSKLHEQYGASFAMTVSRRTSPECYQRLKDKMADLPAYIWDNEGENPYFGILGAADHIIVTADSISMISEACFTGKPVYVYPLKGFSQKFNHFYKSLEENNNAVPFKGILRSDSPAVLDERTRVAKIIKGLL